MAKQTPARRLPYAVKESGEPSNYSPAERSNALEATAANTVRQHWSVENYNHHKRDASA